MRVYQKIVCSRRVLRILVLCLAASPFTANAQGLFGELVGGSASGPDQRYVERYVEFRAECRKLNFNGCTAHWDDASNRSCVQAEPGWAVHVSSVSTESVSAVGLQINCGHTLIGEQSIIDSPLFGPQEMSQGICLRSHIESGGGGRDIGTVFYNVCRTNFRFVNLEQF